MNLLTDRRLLDLQRRLHRTLADQLARESGPISAELAALTSRYERGIPRDFTVVSRERLLADAALARVLFLGDYHSSPRVQYEAATLLAEVATRGARRPVTLALEMVPANCQGSAELFAAGCGGAGELLASIRSRSRWPFPEAGYLRCLEQVRSLGAGVLALDLPRGATHDARSRERFMARRLAEHCALHPSGFTLVLVGNFHLLHDDLPGLFAEEVRARSLAATALVVHQNVERVHWELAERGSRGTVVARFADGSYSIQNTNPLVLVESALLQLGLEGDAPEDLGPDPTDRMVEIVSSLTRYLGLPASAALDFEVFTAADSGFLETLAERGFGKRRLARAAAEILAFDSLVLPELGVIYLHNPTLNHLSEAAARFLRSRICPPAEGTADTTVHFERSVLSQAAGFFGSTVFNPDRRPMGLMHFLRRLGGERALRRGADLARVLLWAARKSFARGPRASESLRSALAPAGPIVQAAAARALGQEVGAWLMDSHRRGEIDLDCVRDLFRLDVGASGLAEHPAFAPVAKAS